MTPQVRESKRQRLVGYVRVSTVAQAEDGFGLEVQEQAIRRWARSRDHRLVDVFRDEGLSGTNELEQRPGLVDAFQAIRTGAADGVVVHRLDRLARDLVLQEQLLAEVRRIDGVVYSTSDSESAFLRDDPSDPSRRLIRQVLGAVGEYERNLIALRLRSGRHRKAERGGYAFGAPPLGYRAEGGELVADEAEQVVVRRIEALRGGGASLRSICRSLMDEGLQPKRGTRWHPQTVAAVLQRTTDAAA